MEFVDKRAVITGAPSGMRRQIALDLARAGARTVLVARNRDRLDEVRREIENETGRDAEAFILDIGDTKAYQDTARQILEKGPVHILINNAGWGFEGPFLDHPPDETEALMKTNYLGVVNGVAAFAPGMKEAGGGHIVNMASVVGLFVLPYAAAYCATKYAVVGLGMGLRLELDPYGVKVITICPSVVDTPLIQAQKVQVFPKATLKPKDVSRAVLRAIRRNRSFVVVPGFLKAAVHIANLFPRTFHFVMAMRARKLAQKFAALAGGKS